MNAMDDDTPDVWPTERSAPSVAWAERFPELEDLFSTHLIELWTSAHETAADALREGLEYRSVAQLRAALTEVNDLLAVGLSDDQLNDILLFHLGSHYHPVDQTYGQWLEEVAAQLNEAVKARMAEGSRGADDSEA